MLLPSPSGLARLCMTERGQLVLHGRKSSLTKLAAVLLLHLVEHVRLVVSRGQFVLHGSKVATRDFDGIQQRAASVGGRAWRLQE